MTLAVAPVTAQQVHVVIANPAGAGFLGRLSASGPKGVTTIPVHLAQGQTELTVVTTGDAGTPWRLRDTQGRLVASLPARRFVPYPLALASVQTVFDGDLKVPSTVQTAPVTIADGQQAMRVQYQFRRRLDLLAGTGAAAVRTHGPAALLRNLGQRG